MKTVNLNKEFIINKLAFTNRYPIRRWCAKQEMRAVFGPSNTGKSFVATGMCNQIATERLSKTDDLSKGHLGTYVLLVHHTDKIAINGKRAERAARAAGGPETELKPHCSQLPSGVASQHHNSGHLS